MANLSDGLLQVTMLVYFLAMLAYLVEFAFGRQGVVARVAARPARELVTAGAPSGDADQTVPPSTDAHPSATVPPASDAQPTAAVTLPPGRAALFGLIGTVLSVIAAAAHIGILVTRGLAAERVPWGNMYEFVLTLTAVAVVVWLVMVLRRPALRQLGVFVAAALTLLVGYAGVVLHTEAAPLMPALDSYWLKIHVSAAALASGLLLVAFVPAALYLVRAGYDNGKRRFPYTIGRSLPAADTLERLSFRMHTFGFPIWTLAVICGAIWAEAAWGRYWGWDPKETWSFVSWVAYAAYLHARATPSVKRTTATWFVVVAWITMVINLYVINFVAVGLHSYAGVE